MIFFAAMAGERWMGSMKMLAASEPEIMENLDSDAMEKLTDRGGRYLSEQFSLEKLKVHSTNKNMSNIHFLHFLSYFKHVYVSIRSNWLHSIIVASFHFCTFVYKRMQSTKIWKI